jgi:hypothetical protein
LQINFGILCDAGVLESWQLKSLNQLLAVADVRAVLLINQRAPAAQTSPLPDNLASLPSITLTDTAPRGGQTTLAKPAVERLQSQNLDFILSFLTERCPPELLESARYGVWAYHVGDWTHYRGNPVGFWEVYEAEPVSAALLVRLQREVDAVVVLREGHLRTNLLSFAGNREQLLARITHWPSQVCIDMGNGITDRLTSQPLVSTAAERRVPTRAQLFNYKCRIAARMVCVGLRSLFRHDQWNVGRIDRPIASFLRPSRPASVQWLRSPNRSEFYADPFGAWRDGRLTILYEHFNYRTNRGTIAAIEPARSAVGAAVQIGPQPAVHLSYPYLIEVEGRLLCIPESHEAAEIGVYEIERFPDRWVKVANLLEGIPIVDATLFRHEGNWWLAGSEPTTKGTTCELHLWHASAITGPWRPHIGNPVKIDIRSARPGGTPFYEDGVLYRPAQDCSRAYGGRVIINRVLTLTTSAFRETQVATVEPDRTGRYPAGLHTLSQVGDITLIDGKRTIFSPAEFRRVLMHYLRKARGACARLICLMRVLERT